MTIYRLHRAGRATGDYTRTELYGGRWNPPGVPMLYATSSLSLACLEVLVHLDKTQFPADFVWSRQNWSLALLVFLLKILKKWVQRSLRVAHGLPRTGKLPFEFPLWWFRRPKHSAEPDS
jgi:hypothetical protein